MADMRRLLLLILLVGCVKAPVIIPVPEIDTVNLSTVEMVPQIENATVNLSNETARCEDSVKASVAPFFWRIEGDPPSYLLGTYHISDKRVLTLPDVVYEALRDTDVVCTEILMGDDSEADYEDYLLPDEGRIEDVLPKDIYYRLDRALSKRGYSVLLLARMKVWFLDMLLESLQYEETYTGRPFLDQYITKISADKQRCQIETPEEHLAVFSILTLDEQIHFLNETLNTLDSTTSDDYEMAVREYLCGDIMFYDDSNLTELEAKFDDVLIHKRNVVMAERIGGLVSNGPSFFIAVGAGHMLGDDGVVTLLEKRGLTVTRVEPKEHACLGSYINISGRCYQPYIKV
jgi:uncharacterized protein